MNTDTAIHAGRPANVQEPGRVQPSAQGHIGWIVSSSLAVGLLTAAALVAAPFIPARMNTLTGLVLLGFALGWALLALLSVRFSDQPQRWAAGPAAFLALAGLISLLPTDSVVQQGFGWGSGSMSSQPPLFRNSAMMTPPC